MSARRPLGLVVATCLTLLAACSTGRSDVPETELEPEPDAATSTNGSEFDYVALGDSFTAGPFVPTTDVANGCFRSNGNYPSLVAEQLDVDDLVDVSCSGASTRDLRKPQATVRDARVPPQLAALSEGTDLVTLGIGGNDLNLFGTLLQTCIGLRSENPRGAPCADQLAVNGTDLVAETRQIGERVEGVIEQIQDRSPDARVLLVGYLRISPANGTCPGRLPFATGDYGLADRAARSLNDALREAARRAGVEFVDMYAASAGHSVCSAEPWVNGEVTDRAAALAYHPLPTGMDAVADAIVELLRQRR